MRRPTLRRGTTAEASGLGMRQRRRLWCPLCSEHDARRNLILEPDTAREAHPNPQNSWEVMIRDQGKTRNRCQTRWNRAQSDVEHFWVPGGQGRRDSAVRAEFRPLSCFALNKSLIRDRSISPTRFPPVSPHPQSVKSRQRPRNGVSTHRRSAVVDKFGPNSPITSFCVRVAVLDSRRAGGDAYMSFGLIELNRPHRQAGPRELE